MNTRKFTKRKTAAASTDPNQKVFDRLRRRQARALLKRRRAKSHQ